MTHHPNLDDPPTHERIRIRAKHKRTDRSKPRSKCAWRLRGCRRKPW